MYKGDAVKMNRINQSKQVRSIGGPLVLADEGMFFVNGKMTETSYWMIPNQGLPDPGHFVVNQMYVHYRIPAKQEHMFPIVMVHGNGLTGVTYETTPDGREGWATYFTRRGFDVYVVDYPGRGRSGFEPTLINQALMGNGDLSQITGGIPHITLETLWREFRFGLDYPQSYPDCQYPLHAIEDFSAQSVPHAELLLAGAAFGTAPPALAALLTKIGPSILIVHSYSGPFADILVGQRPDMIKGVINVEGNQFTIPTDDQVAAYRNVPDLELFGDNVMGNPSLTGQSRYYGRKEVVDRINAVGGNAKIVQLPDIGIHGNTHMLMQDQNNLQIADIIIDWIGENVK